MTTTFYQRVGGADGVRRIVARFYALMDTLPEARPIRALHPPSLVESEEKLYEFLCGWLGGPQLYVEKRGHPRLRARHLPFPIDAAARDQWMLCMSRALDENVGDKDAVAQLIDGLERLADHMRNRP
jgi:hemoglobin